MSGTASRKADRNCQHSVTATAVAAASAYGIFVIVTAAAAAILKLRSPSRPSLPASTAPQQPHQQQQPPPLDLSSGQSLSLSQLQAPIAPSLHTAASNRVERPERRQSLSGAAAELWDLTTKVSEEGSNSNSTGSSSGGAGQLQPLAVPTSGDAHTQAVLERLARLHQHSQRAQWQQQQAQAQRAEGMTARLDRLRGLLAGQQ